MLRTFKVCGSGQNNARSHETVGIDLQADLDVEQALAYSQLKRRTWN